MSDRHQVIDQNMVGIAGNVSQMGTSTNGGSARKRKAIDTASSACGSRVTTYQLIAPKPDTSNSQFTGAGELFGQVREPETQEPSPCQQNFTWLGAIPTNGASVNSNYIPTGGAQPSIPVLNTGESRFTSVEDGMLQIDCSAPQPWGFVGRSTDASGHLPNIPSSPPVIHSDRQLPEQGWIQDTASPLMTCPWRSHLEMIIYIDIALSNVYQGESSTAGKPCLPENLRMLLVELKRSYFKLQQSVQHPEKQTHQDGQPGHLDSVY